MCVHVNFFTLLQHLSVKHTVYSNLSLYLICLTQTNTHKTHWLCSPRLNRCQAEQRQILAIFSPKNAHIQIQTYFTRERQHYRHTQTHTKHTGARATKLREQPISLTICHGDEYQLFVCVYVRACVGA